MNKITPTQVEKLIELVKSQKILFDKGNKFYKYTHMKESIWKDIATVIGIEETDCKNAWRSLRDQFVKATREQKGTSGQEAGERKVYKYYEHLLFLKDTVQSRKRTSNCDTLLEEAEAVLLENEIENLDEVLGNPTNQDHDSPDFPTMEGPSAGPKVSKKAKTNASDEEAFKDFLDGILTEIKTTAEPRQEEENEVTHFFNTVAIMVKNAKLSSVQTRQIQRKVFNFVSEELDKFDSQ